VSGPDGVNDVNPLSLGEDVAGIVVYVVLCVSYIAVFVAALIAAVNPKDLQKKLRSFHMWCLGQSALRFATLLISLFVATKRPLSAQLNANFSSVVSAGYVHTSSDYSRYRQSYKSERSGGPSLSFVVDTPTDVGEAVGESGDSSAAIEVFGSFLLTDVPGLLFFVPYTLLLVKLWKGSPAYDPYGRFSPSYGLALEDEREGKKGSKGGHSGSIYSGTEGGRASEFKRNSVLLVFLTVFLAYFILVMIAALSPDVVISINLLDYIRGGLFMAVILVSVVAFSIVCVRIKRCRRTTALPSETGGVSLSNGFKASVVFVVFTSLRFIAVTYSEVICVAVGEQSGHNYSSACESLEALGPSGETAPLLFTFFYFLLSEVVPTLSILAFLKIQMKNDEAMWLFQQDLPSGGAGVAPLQLRSREVSRSDIFASGRGGAFQSGTLAVSKTGSGGYTSGGGGSEAAKKKNIRSPTHEYFLRPSSPYSSDALEEVYQDDGVLNSIYRPLSPANANLEIDADEIVIRDKIQEGGFGIVYKGTWRGSDVAIKKLKPGTYLGRGGGGGGRERGGIQSPSMKAKFISEAGLLSKLRHPRVVQFLGVTFFREGSGGGDDSGGMSLGVVTEFLEGGSLWDVLRKRNKRVRAKASARRGSETGGGRQPYVEEKGDVDWENMVKVALHTASGMAFLHASGIIHHDLKSANILLDENSSAKICDFGISRSVRTVKRVKDIGTIHWTAPEVLRGDEAKISPKIDVYSFAIILWELITGRVPYRGIRDAQIVQLVAFETARPGPPPQPGKSGVAPDCPVELCTIVADCWAEEPSIRPTFEELMRRLDDLLKSIRKEKKSIQRLDESLKAAVENRGRSMSRPGVGQPIMGSRQYRESFEGRDGGEDRDGRGTKAVPAMLSSSVH